METTISKFSIESKILYNVLKRLDIGSNIKLSISNKGLTFYSVHPKCSISVFSDVLKDYVYTGTAKMDFYFSKSSMYSTFSKKDGILIEIRILSSTVAGEYIFEYIQDSIKHNIRIPTINDDYDTDKDIWLDSPEATVVIRDTKLLANLFKSHKGGLYISTKEGKIRIGGNSDYVVLDNECRGSDINIEVNISRHFTKVFPIISDSCMFNFKIGDDERGERIVNIVFIEYGVVYKYEGNYYNQT